MDELLNLLEEASSGTGGLGEEAARLHERYRQGGDSRYGSQRAALAYACGRMPATAAAVARALSLADGLEHCRSLVDIGCGTGAASWAATSLLPEIQHIHGVDRDRDVLHLAACLASQASHPALQSARWNQGPLACPASADLTLFSYCLNETEHVAEIVSAAWSQTELALAIVEPGTPAGFAAVHEARQALIDAGAWIAGPCPHHLSCPLIEAGEWCHSVQRVERRRFQKAVKGGSRGFEDEKFSWLVALTAPASRPTARLISRPKTAKAAISLDLCTVTGRELHRVSKRDLAWKAARKAAWGDGWQVP
jgi:ribosomal protein RSM22 (predicted rRNA methylase)